MSKTNFRPNTEMRQNLGIHSIEFPHDGIDGTIIIDADRKREFQAIAERTSLKGFFAEDPTLDTRQTAGLRFPAESNPELPKLKTMLSLLTTLGAHWLDMTNLLENASPAMRQAEIKPMDILDDKMLLSVDPDVKDLLVKCMDQELQLIEAMLKDKDAESVRLTSIFRWVDTSLSLPRPLQKDVQNIFIDLVNSLRVYIDEANKHSTDSSITLPSISKDKQLASLTSVVSNFSNRFLDKKMPSDYVSDRLGHNRNPAKAFPHTQETWQRIQREREAHRSHPAYEAVSAPMYLAAMGYQTAKTGHTR